MVGFRSEGAEREEQGFSSLREFCEVLPTVNNS